MYLAVQTALTLVAVYQASCFFKLLYTGQVTTNYVQTYPYTKIRHYPSSSTNGNNLQMLPRCPFIPPIHNPSQGLGARLQAGGRAGGRRSGGVPAGVAAGGGPGCGGRRALVVVVGREQLITPISDGATASGEAGVGRPETTADGRGRLITGGGRAGGGGRRHGPTGAGSGRWLTPLTPPAATLSPGEGWWWYYFCCYHL